MPGFYDLWEYETNNRIGTFDAEADALAFAGQLLALNGTAYAERLSLGYEDDGRGAVIAEGQGLLDLVTRSF